MVQLMEKLAGPEIVSRKTAKAGKAAIELKKAVS
jgi:hypothetical protein